MEKQIKDELREIVRKHDLKNKSREQYRYVFPRQYFYYYCYFVLGYTYQSIAIVMSKYNTAGTPNHTTIRYNALKAKDMIDFAKDREFNEATAEIAKDLREVTIINTKKVIKKNSYIYLAEQVLKAKDDQDLEELKAFVNNNNLI